MIYLLGGSGYIGSAFASNLERKGIVFRNLSRSELDYTNLCVLTAALRKDHPEFLINAAGYTANRMWMPANFTKASASREMLCFRGLSRRLVKKLMCHGVTFPRVAFIPGRDRMALGLPKRILRILPFVRTTALSTAEAKRSARKSSPNYTNVYIWRVRIPFDQFENPRNYLTKVMRYARLLDATNSISELQEFVEASLLCWELRVPFGTYNMTNPGTVTTREVVDLIKKAGLCDREFSFFNNEDDFMRQRLCPPVKLRDEF